MTKSVFKSTEAREAFRAQYNGILSSFPVGQKYVDTAYGQTFVLYAGDASKPPVIVLHGSCSNSAFMTPELMALSGSHRVYAVDIIGEAGNSDDHRPALESGAFADWLREVLDALGIQSAVLVGNSLGGWTALKFATSFPDRVTGLILISPGGLSGQNQAITDQAAAASEKNEPLTVNPSVTGGAQLPKEVEDFMNLILLSYDPITDALPVFTDAQLERLMMPVLFVGGKLDNMLDAAGAANRIRTLLPHAQVHLLENAGHMILNAPKYILPFLMKEGIT